nr:MAG TPA: Neck appendage protein [Caudoviricetes sp.]
MFAKNRTLAIRVGTYQSSDIKEASFEYGYIKGDTYKPGGTCAGSGKITFTSIITTFNKLDKIYPEIGLLVDGTYEWVKMGEYFINDIEIDRNRNTTKFDLMDGMFKLNREYVTDLTFPAEIRQVVKEICLKTGIELANENMDITSMNYAIETKPKEKNKTFRDILSLATQMLGMSCFFNREGKLEIKELTDSGIVITADNYFLHGLTRSEVEYQIAGITCKKDKEGLTVGTRTGRSLEIENPFMTQSILDNLYHKIKDIRYYPFNLNFQGHLLLDVGQWVTIKTNKGETFKSPVLSQSFNFKGGLRSRISADSKAGNDAQYSYAGTITKKIEQFSEFEKQLQNQIEEADRGFNAKVDQIKKDFNDQIELAKAKAKENKRALSDEIDNRFSGFDSSMNEKLEDQRTKIEEIRAIGTTVSRTAEEALEEARSALVSANTSKDLSDSNFAKIEQITDRIRTLVTKQEVDPLTDRLRIAESRIEVQADQITEKLSRIDFDRLANDRGFQTATQVQNLVKNSVDGFQRTISRIETKLRDVIRNDNLLQNSSIIPAGNGLGGSWRLNNSGGSGKTEVVSLTDAPHTAIKKGIRIVNNTNGGNKDIAQGINLVVGEKYTMSCWARVIKPNANLLLHPWASNNRDRYMNNPITNTDWVRYQFTFTADSVYNSIQFGQTGSGSLEICGMKLEHSDRMTDYDVNTSEIVSVADFNDVVDTVKSHTQTIQIQNESISQVLQTADGLVSRVSNFLDDFNLVYDPTNFSKWAKKQSEANVIEVQADTRLLRITTSGKNQEVYHGFALPLNTSTFTKGEKLSYRMEVWVDALPDAPLGIELWNDNSVIASDRANFTKTGIQIITGTMTVQKSSTKTREFPLEIWLMKNGQVAIGQVSLIRGDKPPKRFSDNTSTQDVVTQTQVSQLRDSYAIQTLTGPGAISSQINLNSNNILIEAAKIRLKGRTLLDEITAIDGYFKRLFVGDARVGTLNADIIRSNSISADKLIFDTALAKKLVASDVFTDTLAAKTAFINKLRSVVVSATLLEGYKGRIGGFQIGTHDKDPNSYWITGINKFKVGMGNGSGKPDQTALWVNWGNDWSKSGWNSWYVTNDGHMYCKGEVNFYNRVDFSDTTYVNFYSKFNALKGIWVGSNDINGDGGNPAGGQNAVVWWNQITTGKWRQHAGITTASDRRLKENIKATSVKALDKIKDLNLVAFDYIKDKTHEEIGLIAQEVQEIIPSAIESYVGEDTHLTINYPKIIPYLIKAIQELNQKVERLETTT